MVRVMVMNPKFLKKNVFRHVIIIFTLALIVLWPLVIPVYASEETSIFIDPSTQPVSPGGLFTVDVSCVPAQPIKAFEFTITFNPSLVRVNSVSEGDIFDGYSTFFYNGTIDNIGGTVENIYGLILGLGSVSSSGTFVTVSFTAKSTAGTSPLKLINVGITNNTGYIPIAISNGSVQIIQANQPPVLTGISPTNGSINIPQTRNTVSITIRDPDGDHFNYTIQTRPNIGTASVLNALNGTKSCVITGLSYGTTYQWYVNATDGTHWIRRWYIFTTAYPQGNNPLTFSSMSPSNGSTNVPISTSRISLLMRDPEGKSFNYTIQTRPDIGDVSVHAAQNGTKQCPISGLAYATTYRWFVNATDGVSWKRQWYSFTTESEGTGGNLPNGGGNEDTPPVGDGSSPGLEENTPPNPPSQPLGPTSIQRGVSYAYTSTAFDPDGDNIRLRFKWGDETYSQWTSLISSNVTVTSYHTWNNISSYNVSVIARDENGSYSNWSIPLVVTVTEVNSEEEPPTFDITTPSNVAAGHICQFDVSGILPLNDDPYIYFWEFGDGTTATGKTPIHIYANPGIYNVTLTITDTFGQTYKKSLSVTVPAFSKEKAEEKQGSFPLFLYVPNIGFVVVLLFVIIKFIQSRTKTYSSRKSISQQPRVISNPPPKTIDISYSRTPEQIVQKINLDKMKTISHLTPSYNEDLEKKVDDILLDRIHEMIDNI